MASLKERLGAAVTKIRERRPLIDHVVRTQQHYSTVKGNLQAGAVTYFAFLSFFPILALAFAVIGYVSRIYPDAQQNLVDAIESILPGMIGNDEGEISLKDIEDAAPAIASVGLLVVLYSGLGWLSSMRDALLVVFGMSQKQQPNFVVGKIRDLLAMASLGVTLVLSVAISGVVKGASEEILDWVGLGSGMGWLLELVAVVVGLLANMVLFFAFFKVLAKPAVPSRSLWSGAMLGALGFEALKQASAYLLKSTADQPAFQAFGIALILVVWINYFSRVVMYAASWAVTSRASRAAAAESRERAAQVDRALADELSGLEKARQEKLQPGAAFALGGAATLGLVALARKTVKKS